MRSGRRDDGFLLACLGFADGWAKDEAWRQEGPAAFAKSHQRRGGRLRYREGPARACDRPTWRRSAQSAVWDLARIRSGTMFAATGDAGKVFRREPTKDAPWTVAYDSSDSQALCWRSSG